MNFAASGCWLGVLTVLLRKGLAALCGTGQLAGSCSMMSNECVRPFELCRPWERARQATCPCCGCWRSSSSAGAETRRGSGRFWTFARRPRASRPTTSSASLCTRPRPRGSFRGTCRSRSAPSGLGWTLSSQTPPLTWSSPSRPCAPCSRPASAAATSTTTSCSSTGPHPPCYPPNASPNVPPLPSPFHLLACSTGTPLVHHTPLCPCHCPITWAHHTFNRLSPWCWVATGYCIQSLRALSLLGAVALSPSAGLSM